MWKQKRKHLVYSTYNMVSVSRKCNTPRTMSPLDLCMGFSSTVLLRVVCWQKSTRLSTLYYNDVSKGQDNLVENLFFFLPTYSRFTQSLMVCDGI